MPSSVQSVKSGVNASFDSRLVTLSDGRPGLRLGIHTEVKEPAPEPNRSQDLPAGNPLPEPVLDFIASDETLDRCGEIISAEGWRLDHYRRNPVFQNAHQYGDIIFTLGKALVTEVRHGGPGSGESHPSPCVRPHLFQRIQFAVEANPMARIAYALYKGGFLNAVSVGFIPIRWEDGSGSSSSSKCRRRYLEQELVEVSAVGIPANPEALALGLKSGAVEQADVRELAELLSSVLPEAGDTWPETITRVARELREILRRV
jgi:hypothetical protein